MAPLKPEYPAQFQTWIDTYREALKRTNPEKTLIEIGRAMYRWLNDNEGWLDKILNAGHKPPLFIEMRVDHQPTEKALQFLEAPWELLANANGHLAANAYIIYRPIRRIGMPHDPPEPSPYRLNCVFMAAAPP